MNTRYRRRRYSIHPTVRRVPLGRSPGDRAPPRSPPAPPPLAPRGWHERAAEAQEGSASLRWARVSARFDRKVESTLADGSEYQPVQAARQHSPIARTDQPCPSVPSTLYSVEGPFYASPPRSLSIGQHDPGAGTGGRDASRVVVGNPGAGASEILGAHQQWSNGQSGTTATQRQRSISFAPPARSRNRRRAAGDVDALHRHGHPAHACRRAGGGTGARKRALRAGGRGRRPVAADGSQSDGAGRGETGLDMTRDVLGQSWTEH